MNRFKQAFFFRCCQVRAIWGGFFVLFLVGAAGGASPVSARIPVNLTDPSEIEMIRDRYSQHDALVLFDSTIVHYQREGMITRRRHRAVALLTDHAIRRYGDPRILYNADRQELEIFVSRVYMRDGTTVETQANGFNLTTPFSLARTPDYTGWQEMVVTHVGIEKGCVAELHYEIRDTERGAPWLSGIEIFETEDPTLVRTLEIHLPSDVSLHHISANGAPLAESPAGNTYSWSMRDISGRVPLGGCAWVGDYAPAVWYSTAGSWGEVLRFIAAEVGEKARVTGSLSDVVNDAVEDTRSDEERIIEIHRHVLDGVRSVDAPFGLLLERPREAARIYTTAYAHPLDRAVILSAVLGEAGFESVPVLIAAGKSRLHDVPVPGIFDRMFIEVRLEGSDEETLLLDPTSPFTHDPRVFLSGFTLARCTNAGEIIPLPETDAEKNVSSVDIHFRLTGDDEITGEGVSVLTGIFSPYYTVRGIKNETEKYIEARVEELFEGATVESWNVKRLEKDRVEFGFQFKGKLPSQTQDGRLYLSLPDPFEASSSGITEIRYERSSYPAPIQVIPCILEVSCTYDENSDWKIVSVPAPIAEENGVGTVQITSHTDRDGGTVHRRRLVIGKDMIDVNEYGELRSLLLTYSEDRLVIEKK